MNLRDFDIKNLKQQLEWPQRNTARRTATKHKTGTGADGRRNNARQEDGGKNIRPGDFFASIFLPFCFQ
jgi:hypothetical protein